MISQITSGQWRELARLPLEDRKRIAGLIRSGLATSGVTEIHSSFLKEFFGDRDTTGCYACALGMAVIGVFNGDWRQAKRQKEWRGECYIKFASEILQIPMLVAHTINGLHCSQIKAAEIARYLETP